MMHWARITLVSLLFLFMRFHIPEKCQVFPLYELHLPDEAGNLIYVTPDSINSLNGTVIIKQNPDTGSPTLSPEGTRIAWIEYYEGRADSKVNILTNATNEVKTFEMLTSREWHLAYSLHWLNEHQLMIYYTSQDRPPEVFPFSILDVTSGLEEYIYPTHHKVLFGFETEPLLPPDNTFLDFSPDGRYFIYSNSGYSLFSIEKRQPVPNINFSGGVWLPDSKRLFRQRENDLQLYSISSDQWQTVYSFTDDPKYITSVKSWSPNNRYITVTKMLPRQSTYLNILDLSTSEMVNTCFYDWLNIRTRWSLDGNYLAVEGFLENNRKLGESLYIYDVQNNRIYQVFTGKSGILGWTTKLEWTGN